MKAPILTETQAAICAAFLREQHELGTLPAVSWELGDGSSGLICRVWTDGKEIIVAIVDIDEELDDNDPNGLANDGNIVERESYRYFQDFFSAYNVKGYDQ